MMGIEARLQSRLDADGIDALLATGTKNVYYTTGLWTTPTLTPGDENYQQTGLYTDHVPPKSVSIYTPDTGPRLVVPPAVATNIADQNIPIDADDIYVYGPRPMAPPEQEGLPERDKRAISILDRAFDNRAAAIEAALSPLVGPESTVAVENKDREAQYIRDVVDARVDVAELREAKRLFQELRKVKSETERELMRRAAAINQTAIERAADTLEAGMTEEELARNFKQAVYGQGGTEQLGFVHSFIAFGEHTAHVQVQPGDRTLEPGDIVRFEVGCRYEHYPADLARTYAYKSVADEIERRYDVLYSAMEHCRSTIAAHEPTDVVYESTLEHARSVARDMGVAELEDFDMNMIGHAMGLTIHEDPVLSPVSEPIEPGMVVNYELINAQWGTGCVQLEDTVLVTEDGVDAFSDSPAELPVVE